MYKEKMPLGQVILNTILGVLIAFILMGALSMLTGCAVGLEPYHAYDIDVPSSVTDEASALAYVQSHVRYATDRSVHGEDEYWQGPKETERRATGDCEDQAILMAALCANMGMEAEVVAGFVTKADKNAHEGHCVCRINGKYYDPCRVFQKAKGKAYSNDSFYEITYDKDIESTLDFCKQKYGSI